MTQTVLRGLLVLGVVLAAAFSVLSSQQRDDAALREQARAALRTAVEFYRTKVATQGGYHFAYAQDLSYGRSEMSEGPHESRSSARARRAWAWLTWTRTRRRRTPIILKRQRTSRAPL